MMLCFKVQDYDGSMKTILICFSFFLFSHSLQAEDQLLLLKKGRNHHLKLAMQALRKHCPFLDLYVCRVRLESDCANGIRKEKTCVLLRGIEETEQRYILSQKQIHEYSPRPLVLYPPEVIPMKTPVIYQEQVSKHDESVNPVALKKKTDAWRVVKGLSLKQTCREDSECKVQHYGVDGCVEGREGVIAISTRVEQSELQEALAKYADASMAFNKKRDEPFYCPAVITRPVTYCRDQVCEVQIVNN